MPRRLKPEHLKALCGTRRKDRQNIFLFKSVGRPVEAPDWLKGRALELFREKVRAGACLGLDVAGCESLLAQLCCLEERLEECWRDGSVPSGAALRLHLAFLATSTLQAGDWYDLRNEKGPLFFLDV